ncbi:hypothetical protein, partial [Microcoleus sp. Pol12B5]|uniref:hypothetical protein n=1 Tax=Microcoleus sp. Pol12B5 TaxID=3055396 RepID=UPI002FD2F03D
RSDRLLDGTIATPTLLRYKGRVHQQFMPKTNNLVNPPPPNSQSQSTAFKIQEAGSPTSLIG